MTHLKRLYRDYERIWCNVVFPLILLVYPLVLVNQGIDVSDSTYSLSNFLYFQEMEGMWVVSTYLSNLAGWVLTCLTFGKTLLGMNIYTGLLVSVTVLLVYGQLRKWMPAWIIFLGEFVAVGFLWIPTTILYNYLTYFLFALGTILLYKGLVEEKDGYLIVSGAVLGLNVFVRIPNITEMALILGLWYYLAVTGKPFSILIKKTGLCILGYMLGLVLPLGLVVFQYGFSGLVEAIAGLAAIQSTDASYSPFAMVASIFKAYFRSGKWLVIMGIPTAFGMGMFAFKKGQYERGKQILFLAGVLVILRFLWGRGMFSFRYYEDYTSMYEWGMMGLFLAWIAAVYMLGSAKTSAEEKLMAVLTMVILAVTPLGSNNYTYQNLNNLFLPAPFTLYTFVKVYRYRKGTSPLYGLSFPWKAMVAVVGVIILIQTTGFHFNFSFGDGMDGTPRNSTFSAPRTLAGMKTTWENAENIGSLHTWLEENGYAGSGADKNEKVQMILYGNCPGLSFLYEIPFAIKTAWPDLDSYPYESFVQELKELEGLHQEKGEKILVVLRDQEPSSEQGYAKKEYLQEWMERNGYVCRYENEEYAVYLP